MRIASLSPAATEMLFALGLQEYIVCRDQFSTFPQAARDIPRLKGHQEIDTQELRSYALELVLTGTVVQQALAAKLEAEGHSVLHQDPRTLLEIEAAWKELGLLFQVESKAQQEAERFRQAVNTIRRKARLLPRKPRVYVEEWHQPPMASGNWVPELVKAAGGEPFPIPAGELSRKVSFAEVQEFDPDLLVISWCGAGSLADPTLLTQREEWKTLRAVEEGNVRVIDDSLLNRPGPRLPEGAARIYGWLFELLH